MGSSQNHHQNRSISYQSLFLMYILQMIKYILHTDTPNSRSHSNLSKKVGFPARNSTHQHAGKTPISRGFFQWNSDDLLINVCNILQEVFYFLKKCESQFERNLHHSNWHHASKLSWKWTWSTVILNITMFRNQVDDDFSVYIYIYEHAGQKLWRTFTAN